MMKPPLGTVLLAFGLASWTGCQEAADRPARASAGSADSATASETYSADLAKVGEQATVRAQSPDASDRDAWLDTALAAGPGKPAAGSDSEPYDKPPVDPIKANGKIFEGWGKPEVAIVISGLQDGYLEPCGCAGLTNQKGGLARRHTFIKGLKAGGWPVLPVDLGGIVRRYGRQQEIKYERTVDGLKTIGYRAVGFGPEDLRLPAESILAVAAPVGDAETPFTSANVTVLDESIVPRYKVFQVGGRRIGVTSVLGSSYQDKISNDGIEFTDPGAALEKVMPQLIRSRCDVMILLSHSTVDESKALAVRFPQFHFVVTAGGAEEPPAQLVTIEKTRSRMVEVGHKGMYAAVIGLFDDAKQPVKYQRVPLDHRFEDSAEMKQLMRTYQDTLRTIVEQSGWEGLDIKPAAHPSGHRFVGSQACADCHSTAHGIWSETGHAHATETLEKLDIPRHFDPECLSCHVTGWEPQRYVPFESGFLGLEKTPDLVTNGCENCHGPGSAHVAAESGESDASEKLLAQLRTQMRVAKKESTCIQCHDLDNSPDFVKEGGFEEYWPKVEHYGRD